MCSHFLSSKYFDSLDKYDRITISQVAQIDNTFYESLAKIGFKQIAYFLNMAGGGIINSNDWIKVLDENH
ncbi:hypothetical protein [Facklamia sp. P12950]|uniref:hypothetical protein n=1 Tax=Facklamia sp. P12950 TaxID=3421951 RepID=UPI003D175931